MVDTPKQVEYNLFVEGAGDLAPLSKFPEGSLETQKWIEKVGIAAQRVKEKHFPFLANNPIIAGGAVRDMVYGYSPKDYDLFVNMTETDGWDPDDILLLFAQELQKELDCDPANGYIQKDSGGDYAGDTSNHFLWIWSVLDFNNEIDIQIIGFKDTFEKPLDYVERFDYPLVKALYSADTNEFMFHEEFLKAKEATSLLVTDSKTYRRVRRWVERTGHKLKLMDRVEAPKPKFSPFVTIPYGQTAGQKLKTYWNKNANAVYFGNYQAMGVRNEPLEGIDNN